MPGKEGEMILTISKHWEVDTSIDEGTGVPWADLWHDGYIIGFIGEGCIERCLDRFRAIVDMSEDAINDWQQG